MAISNLGMNDAFKVILCKQKRGEQNKFGDYFTL